MKYMILLLSLLSITLCSSEGPSLPDPKQFAQEEQSLLQILSKVKMSEEEFTSSVSQEILGMGGFSTSYFNLHTFYQSNKFPLNEFINKEMVAHIINSPCGHGNIAVKYVGIIYYCKPDLLNTLDAQGRSPLLNCLRRGAFCENDEIEHVIKIAKELHDKGANARRCEKKDGQERLWCLDAIGDVLNVQFASTPSVSELKQWRQNVKLLLESIGEKSSTKARL